MAEKQPIKEQIKKLTDQIEAGIKALFQSGDLEKYQAYLHTMSHFHHYSVNNQMLIFSQCPHATLVAGVCRMSAPSAVRQCTVARISSEKPSSFSSAGALRRAQRALQDFCAPQASPW